MARVTLVPKTGLLPFLHRFPYYTTRNASWYESGNYSKVHQRYACVKPLRNAMQQFAWQSTALEPWARAYYQRKRTEGKSHSMAVRALSNVWVRIIFAMWQKQEPYERTIFEKAKRLHVARAA